MKYDENIFSYKPLSPIEVVAACLIFAGFSKLEIERDFSKLSGYTFLIYLIHPGIWDVISTIIGDRLIGNQDVEVFSIILLSAGVFVLSFITATIYKKIASCLKYKYVRSKGL